jgi:hypothetical protein
MASVIDDIVGLQMNPFYYGVRDDKTLKGHGWLGNISNNKKNKITELSIGVNLGGKEYLIPSIVPTLSKQEIDWLGFGNNPTNSIIDKAVNFAVFRLKNGQNPFF